MATQGSFISKIHPVILSGGTGTRLWPMSRAQFPKQLISLASELTLLQETVRRVGNIRRFGPCLVVCNDEHRFVVAQQLRVLGVQPRAIVLEPQGRSTAPAAAVAALMLAAEDSEALLLVLPSDHVVRDVAGFHAALDIAAKAARGGALVTFGVTPCRPETGYGYVRRGAELADVTGCYYVTRFVEKPDRTAAESLIAGGECYWNSGMFLFTAARYLDELGRLQPDMLAACRSAVERGHEDLDFFRLNGEALGVAPALSINYAVMEHTSAAAVVPTEMGLSDVGVWLSLWEIGTKDADGNVLAGDVSVAGVRNSYIRAVDRMVAVIGLEDVVIVATRDAVLAIARDKAQAVKALVDTLKADSRSEWLNPPRVYRPWGYYEDIDAGDRFRIKRVTIDPGAKLSLQKHRHRAEHWVVVSGIAKVRRGDDTLLLHENESTYIPLGVVHCLENSGTEPLQVIEVQLGRYLGEDDIVRLEDTYTRAGPDDTPTPPA